MSVKLSGADWLAFYADPEVWPQEETGRGWEHARWYDDAYITVDGVSIEELPETHVIAPDAQVVVDGGVYYHSHAMDATSESFETVVRRWLRQQSHETIVVQVPKTFKGALVAMLPAFKARVVNKDSNDGHV